MPCRSIFKTVQGDIFGLFLSANIVGVNLKPPVLPFTFSRRSYPENVQKVQGHSSRGK